MVNADLVRRFRTLRRGNAGTEFPYRIVCEDLFLHFQFGPDGYSRFWYAVAIFGHFSLSGLNIQRERREEGREERKRGVVMLFYATRSLILSIILAGRISVQAINEKAPTIDHVCPWFVLQLLGLLSLRLPKLHRGLESE